MTGIRLAKSPNASNSKRDRIEKGAYFLCLRLKRPVKIHAGALGNISLPAGDYVYVGSARRGIAQRIARHRRLAETKKGKLHWHIDYLLLHPRIKLIAAKGRRGENECAVSKHIAAKSGVSAPVPGFGATDCRARCQAHLYLLKSSFQKTLRSDDGGEDWIWIDT